MGMGLTKRLEAETVVLGVFHTVCPVPLSRLAIPLISVELVGGSSPGDSLAVMTRPRL